LFKVESKGRVERTPEGQIVWNREVDNPQHRLVTPNVSNEKMEQIIEELMARPPSKRGENSPDS
jgi:hypothetical protein